MVTSVTTLPMLVTTLPTLPLPAAVWFKPRLSSHGLHRLGPRPAPPTSFAMAPHMSNGELDRATALHASGKTAVEVRALLQRARAARGQPGPDLTTVRRALRGSTRQRARVETRGRKAKLTVVKLRALDAARRRLIQQAKGETEVHIKDLMKAMQYPERRLIQGLPRLTSACSGLPWACLGLA